VSPFRWKHRRLVTDLEPHEAALLRQVVTEVHRVLSGDADQPTGAAGRGERMDPVTERLLPDGHRGDPKLAEDYRTLTEDGIRQEKLADADLLLQTVSEDGGRVELDLNAAEAWLRTINDVRLTFGVLLGVQESDDPLVQAAETGDQRWGAYAWLTAVQGLLVDALASGSRRSSAG